LRDDALGNTAVLADALTLAGDARLAAEFGSLPSLWREM
jgi:hypothetical protein